MSPKVKIPLHPDDLMFFHEVSNAMWKVAHKYRLPLRSITAYPMPERDLADRLGDCSADGHIRLVMRATIDGLWASAPRTPELVWKTAAHELAHLRHFNHGDKHAEFQVELLQALENLQENHQEKVVRKLVKLQKARDGEAALGNTAAAESFAAMINRMLLEHELHPSAIDYASATDNDPVIELPVNLKNYGHPEKKVRIAWEESLARIVAKAHLCTFLLRTGSNQIWFVGTKSHAIVAEYAYGTLLPVAARLADEEYYNYHMGLRREGKDIKLARGFRPAWLDAFVGRIAERFEEERRQAVADAPEGTSVALMRLDGALAKARKYVDDKFRGRGGAQALAGNGRQNAAGRAWGRAAADRMAIGRRGVSAHNAPIGRLKS